MPRRKTHAIAGGGSGLVAGIATMPDASDEARAIHLAGAVIGGVIGGVAPDLLEPALSPRHRGLLHSVAVGGAVGAAALARWHADCLEEALACERRCGALLVESADYQRERLHALLWRLAAGLIVGFFAGYASHLALDAGTAAGLPLITKEF